MTPADLLRTLGLQCYLAAFETSGIDAEVLPTLTDADLRELGVAKLGDRKKLLAAIARLPGGATGPGPAQEWAEAWPTPVAVALREYAREEHPVARLWAACDAVEMALRLLVIAGVARQARDGVLPEKRAREMCEILETPTLGGWFVLAQALAGDGEPAEAAWVKGPLRDLLYGPDKPGTPETSFLRLRNRLAHGGGLTRAEAARLLSLWRERFEAAFAQGNFFAGWELLGRETAGGWRHLRGPAGGPAEAPAVPAEANAAAVWLRRGEQMTLLWPLAIYGPPIVESATRDGGDAAQVYSRKEAVRLAYTPVGLEGVAQSESGEGALRAFERLFESGGRADADFKVAGCEADLRKDAAQMVGRQRELEQVLTAIRATTQGVLWLSGAAGMGKSFLLAKVATSLMEEHQGSRTLVLAYRFRAGDQARCSRERLAQFVVERLQAAAVLKPFFDDKPKAKAADRLSNALGLIADDVRVILLLDGLDEIQRRDETFAEEVALGVRVPRLVCGCAGRPEPAIEQAMRRLGGRTLFAEGLPPMGGDDIRGMLLEKIGPLRRTLLGHDRERGDAVVNPFIELVTKRAAGLPLYVKYVVGDVLANRYQWLNGYERLPDSLHAYHEELLRRLGVGDLQAVVTPLAAALACAYEPLTLEQLEAVFLHRKLIQPAGGSSLLERGLAALAAMVTSAPTPEGATGYTLFHQSLRDHILKADTMIHSVANMRAVFAELALCDCAHERIRSYVYRCGIRHLIDVGDLPGVESRLCDIGWLAHVVNASSAEAVAAHMSAVPAERLVHHRMRDAVRHEAERNLLGALAVTDVLRADNQIESAVSCYLELARLAAATAEHDPLLDRILFSCARAEHSRADAGGYDRAEPLYRSTLELRIARHGERSQEVAEVRRALGMLLLSRRHRFPEADSQLFLAYEIYLFALGENHHFVAEVLLERGILAYWRAARGSGLWWPRMPELIQGITDDPFGPAEIFFIQALQIYERGVGRHHKKTLEAVHYLQQMTYISEKYEDSIQWFERLTESGVDEGDQQNHRLYSMSIALSESGSQALSRGDREKAIEYYKRAVECSDRLNGGKPGEAGDWPRRLLAAAVRGDARVDEIEIIESPVSSPSPLPRSSGWNIEWEKVSDCGSFSANAIVTPWMVDPAERTLHGISPSTGELRSLNLDNAAVKNRLIDSWPNRDLHNAVFDPARKRFYVWRAGRDTVYEASLSEPHWKPVGRGRFDGYSYGASTVWSRERQSLLFFGGYGFWAVKNWLIEMRPDRGEWDVIQDNIPGRSPYPRTGVMVPGPDGSAILFGTQGSATGLQHEAKARGGVPVAGDIGCWAWLRDLWKLDLKTLEWSRILPHNHHSITRRGPFIFNQATGLCLIARGEIPSGVKGGSCSNLNGVIGMAWNDADGFLELSESGDIPPDHVRDGILIDVPLKAEVLFLSIKGIWRLKLRQYSPKA